MEPRATRRRDPALAALFSAVIPGTGLLYAGELVPFVAVLVVETALFVLGWWVPLLPIHVVQIAISAGTAAACGERERDIFAVRRDLAVTGAPESPPPSP